MNEKAEAVTCKDCGANYQHSAGHCIDRLKEQLLHAALAQSPAFQPNLPERCCDEYPECTHTLYWYEGFKEGLKHPEVKLAEKPAEREQVPDWKREGYVCASLHRVPIAGCRDCDRDASGAPERPAWKCKANPTADPPQDCDWPTCGCDPHASKVIEALQESGHLPDRPQLSAEQRLWEGFEDWWANFFKWGWLPTYETKVQNIAKDSAKSAWRDGRAALLTGEAEKVPPPEGYPGQSYWHEHNPRIKAAELAAAPPVLQAEPFAYVCPANCGCMWRDNHDGTMSLFGKSSQSCEVCEPLPLDKLIPVFKARALADSPVSGREKE